jgi:hypothetical protein
MTDTKNRHWNQQIDGIAREISKLALVLNIDLSQDGLAERVLKNDDSVCRRKDPDAFRHLRQHLMALFPLGERAIERLGADETKAILDQVRASIRALREAGGTAAKR